MSGDFKEQVLAAVPIEAYIGRVTTLKKKGRTLSGLCPFHKEKTPSFTVNPDKGLYHCFGCGRGGDLFRFVMDYENVSFPDALDLLARFAGIEKPRVRSGPGQDRKDRLLEINAAAQQAFREALNGSGGAAARRYLEDRGLRAESIETFGIGFAPGDRDFLAARLADRVNELHELGLLRRSEDGRQYEFFRDRVIFPIRDVRGAVVAFGGRTLPGTDHPAKYLNSTDSPVFHKSSVLYGLYTGLAEIRSRQVCYLVEGYLDVVGLYQCGVKNVVAPMGTALTAEHLKLLRRYSPRVVLLLDGDPAGRAAALKSARLIVDHGDMEADLILLSNGLDPFDLARSATPGQLERVLAARVSAERFLLVETLYPGYFAEWDQAHPERAGADGPMESLALAVERQRVFYAGERADLYPVEAERKKAALRRLFSFLAELTRPAAREFFLADGARILSISLEAIQEEWRATGQVGATPRAVPAERSAPATAGARQIPVRGAAPVRDPLSQGLRRCEESLILEFAFAPGVAAEYIDLMREFPFEDEGAETFWRYLENRIESGDIWTGDSLDLGGLPEDTFQQFSGPFTRKVEEYAFRATIEGGDPREPVEDLLRDHHIRLLERRLQVLDRERALAGSLERESLLAEQGEILKEMRGLKTRQRGHSVDLRAATAPKNGASGANEVP